ncbi:MAG: hypothetical protein HZB12_01575 [Candidatus Yonathbacteria bacterium]|nr:hypothetical protein [Candidatus Yonathbacteria bacterium]
MGMENFGIQSDVSAQHARQEDIAIPFSAFEELEKIDRDKLRPQIDEIFGQLIASEKNGAYSEALTNLESNDKEIKNDAIEYLARHQAYLMDGVDTLLRMGFDNPEEKAVSDEANTRLGVIFEKLAKVTH